jgi:hypothetical protein
MLMRSVIMLNVALWYCFAEYRYSGCRGIFKNDRWCKVLWIPFVCFNLQTIYEHQWKRLEPTQIEPIDRAHFTAKPEYLAASANLTHGERVS